MLNIDLGTVTDPPQPCSGEFSFRMTARDLAGECMHNIPLLPHASTLAVRANIERLCEVFQRREDMLTRKVYALAGEIHELVAEIRGYEDDNA